MWKYAFNKLLYGIAVLLGIIVVVFFLFNVLPGDPARMTQGQRSDIQSLEAVRKEFGLDKPVYIQFIYYINDLSVIAIHESDTITREKYNYFPITSISKQKSLVLKMPYLRRSYQSKRNVSIILSETIPNTFVLAITAMIFATLIGIVLGVISAVNQDTWIDRTANAFAILGISAPSFFAGIIIAWLFGFVLSDYT
ncbi:MAG: binding-protein-dependent transport system inner rane component, partial [Daejeonella sp.]|nr:binding-protein-dependent transport system inner rane component [Daejeonella sp.]